MANFKSTDVVVGLALFVDPDVLLRDGARFTGEETDRIRGPHFFLCLERDERFGKWLPLFSSHRFDRMELAAGKAGSPGWTGPTTYYDPNQLWTVRHAAILKAAEAAGDASGPWEPNTADQAGLPDLWWLKEKR